MRSGIQTAKDKAPLSRGPDGDSPQKPGIADRNWQTARDRRITCTKFCSLLFVPPICGVL